jgi:hypothetical protein
VTLLAAIIAPLMGALADAFGVGVALAGLGALMAALALLVRVSTPDATGASASAHAGSD